MNLGTLTKPVAFTALALLAFAGNSLLCRVALKTTAIDPVTFTTIRLVSGALMLWLIVQLRRSSAAGRGNWLSAAALFAYAIGFSLAYLFLSAGAGALLLFGAVQVTMIGVGLWSGERLKPLQLMGFILALAGLVGLLLPGAKAPPLISALLMLGAGAAWGVYSLRGRGAGDPTRVTAGNFLRAAPLALVVSAGCWQRATIDGLGLTCAIASGAVTSGIGYALWYAALPQLKATTAAAVQLSVPVLVAVGGIALLGEAPTWRLFFASVAILGGIALVLLKRPA